MTAVKAKGKAKANAQDAKLEANIDTRLLSGPTYRAPVPRMHMWSTSLPVGRPSTPSESTLSSGLDNEDIYATPTMRQSLPNFLSHRAYSEDGNETQALVLHFPFSLHN